MPFTYDHFGKRACFDNAQAPVVKALVEDYLRLFSENVRLEIEKEELEGRLRELQAIVDASISNLDPDR